MNLIVDGNNLLFRTFWILKTQQGGDGSDNMLTFMFLRNLKSYCDMFSPTDIFLCWDKKLVEGATNFRYESAPDYKGDRDPQQFEGVFDQMDQIVEMTSYLGINNMYPRVLEADDVIAWLSVELGGESVIVSNDQDLWQLVSDQTSVYVPNKKVTVKQDNFIQYSKVPHDWYVQYKALVGDKSDNIQGLHRMGEKTAVKLLENWDLGFANLPDSEQKLYNRNLELVDLSRGYTRYPAETASYAQQLEDAKKFGTTNFKKFIDLCEELNYSTIVNKKSDWFRIFIESKRLQQLFG